MKLPVPAEVQEALDDTRESMEQMTASLDRIEGLLVKILDALTS